MRAEDVDNNNNNGGSVGLGGRGGDGKRDNSLVGKDSEGRREQR